MSKHSIFKDLPCDLTDNEVATYSQELARVTSTQAEIENNKKEVMSDFTAKLNKCIADARVLARKITMRREDRHIECDLEFDYSKGMVYTIRLDTGVTIDQRKLTDDERQQKINFEAEQDLKQQEEDAAQEPPIIEAEILQIEYIADEEEAEVSICVNTDCAHYDSSEPNGCLACESTWECDQCIQMVAGKEISADERNRRDLICADWKKCQHGENCMDDSINTDCVCYVDKPAAIPCAELVLSFQDLTTWEHTRNEAKILTAGFSLVKYDRDSKIIYTTAEDPRSGWKASRTFETFAAAERQLEYEIAAGFIHVAINTMGSVVGYKCMKVLRAAGFEFYRNGGDRIKFGDSWKTWKKFDDSMDCVAAFDSLMSSDAKALED